MTGGTVFVVIVTFNRLPLLKKTVTAVKMQTYMPAGIVVVNNSSTDGTGEWLDAQQELIVIHQENVGGAGGFHTGVKQAMASGADWIWVMDDDVLPEEQCLERLLQHQNVSLCLNPVHVSANGELSEEERWFDATDCTITNLHNRSCRHGKKLWFRNLGSFEGMLIAREIVEKIGLPDKRFFIAHDDLAYGYLASKFTNVAVVADAVMHRQPVVKAPGSTYNYDYYYMYRNLWLLEEYAARELPSYNGYRRRRIRLQFLYAVYKIFFVDRPPMKGKALSTLYRAYRDYQRKKAGKRE